MSKVIAVLCSDIHLSERPPIARAGEPDWYAAMGSQLEELRELALDHKVPICCAGDVFDRWKSSPQLINFAIDNVPKMYSVAGQHDLPMHQLYDINKSAYWTLVECKILHHLRQDSTGGVCVCQEWKEEELEVFGNSWGEENYEVGHEDAICLLVAHKYVWYGDSKYPGATQYQNINSNREMFKGYNVALLGDNHKPWKAKIGECLVYNPGSFFRRRSDEVDHRPQVGLLKEDRTIEIHYLDVSQDVFEMQESARLQEKVGINMDEFLEDLKGLGESGLDFVEAIKAFLDRERVGSSIREIIMKAME